MTAPVATPSVPKSLLRTQARPRDCSRDPRCDPPAPAPSSGGSAGSLGQPGRAQREVPSLTRLETLTMVSATRAEEAAPTQTHGRRDPGGGCSSDSATGPRRQHRAGSRAAA